MRLTRIALSNLRNYATLEIEPAPGLNLFVGPNAQGKTNLLEAIAMLGTGKSFRTAREHELIKQGESLATLSAKAEVDAGSVSLSCTITSHGRGARKIYGVNGHPVRYASYLGRVRVVTFTPDDLRLINGSPQARRSLLNAALAQESPAYYGALAAYGRALVQKNALLRTGMADPTLIEVYDVRMVEAGTQVMLARDRFVMALAERATAVYRRLVGVDGEELTIRYIPNVVSAGPDALTLAGAFAAKLKAAAPSETARRVSLAGPHRDDIGFFLDGKPINVFGSQGQRRSAVLAVKVAEYGVLRERGGEAPLLLLDDVLSELDARRSEMFIGELTGIEQAFITATSMPHSISAARRFEVMAARVREQTCSSN
jgi:DNA replication and repair protein RecF